ncbi:pilus assembly protein [Providencia stuartii]|uniref:Pilus assembly protein n=1 Tax=Providencia stuartii TaxID=588 RepID=A0A1S1HRB5_PROST|nr:MULTISPECIES: pilus assembly protein [Providencia]ELR5301501.1 pilus assembly protein [Providencia stuartii]MDV5228131.1 pilus assembly protein [Providencia rettgeri]MDW7589969.1 pilus assembly protein [Providencia sp. 2023EL-00965]OHT24372.1 pilus assembly protein [Providencia stuartii]
MNKKKIISALSFVLLTASLFSTNVQANIGHEKITFKAAIVFPPCSYNVANNGANLNCFDGGTSTIKTSNIHNIQQSQPTGWQQLENNRGVYQFQWTNKAKNLAMLSVEYL